MLPKYKDELDNGIEEKDRRSRKDRFTFMACANKTGDNKLKLLLIGKTERIDDSEHYNHDENGSLTRDLFRNWFHQQFVPAVREFSNKKGILPKAVLVLDNCSAHNMISPLTSEDGRIFTFFLPPNVSSLSQPMEQGIFSSLKLRYRKKLLRHVMLESNESPVDTLNSLNDSSCMNWLIESWNEMPETTFQKSWRKLLPSEKNLELQDDTDIEMEDEIEINDEDISEKEQAEEIHEEILDQDIVQIILKLHEKSNGNGKMIFCS